MSLTICNTVAQLARPNFPLALLTLMFVNLAIAESLNGQLLEVVSPMGFDEIEGDTRNSVPANRIGRPLRVQYLHSAADFHAISEGHWKIVGMSVRLDGGAVAIENIELDDAIIRVAATDETSLGKDYEANAGEDVQVVLEGEVSGSYPGNDSPNEFGTPFMFEIPFAYDPSLGNLLVDLVFPNGYPTALVFDAQSTPGTSTAVGGFDDLSGLLIPPSSGEAHIVRRFLFAPVCDFGNDGQCDTTDIDLMFSAGNLAIGLPIERPTAKFDLNFDQVIDTADVNEWLSSAAERLGFASPFLAGDTNLDGKVDSTDLNALALSWQQSVEEWSRGDFTGDRFVDSSDLNALGINWQQSIPSAAASVPEPPGFLSLFVAGFIGIPHVARMKAHSN